MNSNGRRAEARQGLHNPCREMSMPPVRRASEPHVNVTLCYRVCVWGGGGMLRRWFVLSALHLTAN